MGGASAARSGAEASSALLLWVPRLTHMYATASTRAMPATSTHVGMPFRPSLATGTGGPAVGAVRGAAAGGHAAASAAPNVAGVGGGLSGVGGGGAGGGAAAAAVCSGASCELGRLSAAAPDGCSASLNISDSGTSPMLAFSLHVCASCLSHRTHAAPRRNLADKLGGMPASTLPDVLFASRSG